MEYYKIMTMKNTIILVLCAAVLSGALSAIVTSAIGPKLITGADTESIDKLQQRIKQMEVLLDQEKLERLKLQQQIAQGSSVNIDIDNQLVSEDTVEGETDGAESNSQKALEDPTTEIQQFRQTRRSRTLSETRKRRLVAAGFAEEEANWLLKNESDVQLQTLYRDHEARLQNSQSTPRVSSADQLRANIGDDYYERYLKANNRSTNVSVGSILGSSPGENAGLQTGDRIVRYAGERVFNVRDLNNLTVQGTAGESVLIEVERNGSPLQLTIPRGPVGINANRQR